MVYNSNIPRGTNPTFTAGANKANPLIPIEASREIIKVAIEKSVVLQYARKQDMGTSLRDMPVLALKPSAYWVSGDQGLKQTTALEWKNVRLTAEEIAVLVVVPQNVLNDSAYDLWGQIKPELGEAIGRALDAAVLFGTNAPASWGVNTSLSAGAVAAGNTVAHGTATAPKDLGSDISNVIASVEADGFIPSGIVMAQSLRAYLRDMRDTTGQFLLAPPDQGLANATFGNSASARTGTIFGLPAATTLSGVFEASLAGALGTELIVVDWSQVIIGVRQDITFDISKEAVISDGAGVVVMNAWQQDSVVLRCVARFGYAVPNPVTRLQPTEGSRWPAGVLREAS